MPQIAQILETYASQAFWLLIVFGLLYFGIARAMLPKIDATVDARDRKIGEDLAAAEKARAAAVNLEAEYQADLARVRAGAQAEAAKAKAKAQMDAANRLAKADGELAAKTTQAEVAIAASRDAALAGIESVAAESAQAIAAKVAGLNVPAADAAIAVRAVLNG